MTQPIHGRFHVVYTDKFYTSVLACKRLLNKEMYMTGAVKSNSLHLPIDLIPNANKNPDHHQEIKDLAKAPRGTFLMRQNGQLTSTVWKDTKVLQLLSTAEQPFRQPSDTLARRTKEDNEQQRSLNNIQHHLRLSTIRSTWEELIAQISSDHTTRATGNPRPGGRRSCTS